MIKKLPPFGAQCVYYIELKESRVTVYSKEEGGAITYRQTSKWDLCYTVGSRRQA